MQLEQCLQEASYPLRHDIDLHLTVMAVRRLPFIANLSGWTVPCSPPWSPSLAATS